MIESTSSMRGKTTPKFTVRHNGLEMNQHMVIAETTPIETNTKATITGTNNTKAAIAGTNSTKAGIITGTNMKVGEITVTNMKGSIVGAIDTGVDMEGGTKAGMKTMMNMRGGIDIGIGGMGIGITGRLLGASVASG